ncbi:putative NADH-flavin reductase [Ceratocystis platani]|uniref:Putative NADH-flavin reductase n=1 Tax=Ceratocystis fimbriata f. sp. platani TaxID=88771 RepID=A0A0F8AZJ6_CERFI|nr:putative NADH-flavin reductase [Ceratocystis platani]
MTSIQKVAVVGASGNVGRSTTKALLEQGFQVTGITREQSNGTTLAGVKHIKSDYSEESLVAALKGHDALVSTVSSIVVGESLAFQKTIIDAAIKAGVKTFVPSEYGVDTANPVAPKCIPFLQDKIDILNYLKSQENKISWIAIISGSMFDWGLNIPGFGGWDVKSRTATIFDGGDIPYEATNLDQVGRAIALSLKSPDLTRNQYVYINSFTVTQNDVLKALEKATDSKWEVSQGTVTGLWDGGAEQVKNGNLMGTLAQIAGTIYGKGGLANYSVDKGLWNDKIGLAGETLDDCLQAYFADK